MNFYRVTDYQTCSLDQWGEPIICKLPNPQLRMSKLFLVKETPKGYWISASGFEYDKVWVSKTARKRYAYPTKEQAIESYIARTTRRLSILKTQLDYCEAALFKAQQL